MHNTPTLTDFILQEEKKMPHATGSLSLILTLIENAGKIIASHARQTGLVDMLGKTGETNAYNDEVHKLDTFSNTLLVDTLLGSGHVYAVLSEELAEPVLSEEKQGDYIVCIDPLDGSANVDSNASLGTIFSIYKKTDDLLQPGEKQVAAGYILYGPSTLFVYTCGNGVNGFTLDPSIGSFLLSHPTIIIPQSGTIYAMNEAKSLDFTDDTQQFLSLMKHNGANARYVGCMVADIHRTLIQGGIFLYPADKKRLQGKIRLLYEVNPLSFIVEQAGGMATSNGTNPLTILPSHHTQQVPIVLGSKELVETYLSFIS